VIFQVRVKCYGERPGKKLGSPFRPCEWSVRVLVEAKDRDAAVVEAKSFAESHAPTYMLLTEVTALETAPFGLPALFPT